MKKLLMAVALAGLMGATTVQIASAHRGFDDNYRGYGPGGYGYCNPYFEDYGTRGDGDLEKFREETNELRKNLAVSRNELRALLRQDNPDEKKVAKLTGKIFDLETELDKKAKDSGITGRNYYGGHGPGMMWDNRRGYGRHMMDW